MNKQELIDELAKYVKSYENAMDEHGQGRYGAYEVSLKLVKRLNESKITDEQAWNKVAEAYPESAQSLRNTLDNAVFGKTGEPQKHVMPKFVADWFEDNKHALDLAIFTKIRELDGKRYPHETDFENWLDNAENNPIETLIRMKDGYEVEKEPVWAIKNADGNYLTKCALWGKDGVNYSFECNPSHRLLFTDKATADAAALLVNGTVEEVAEG
ncbi:DUF1642 domain-containing protein [Enterococcus faecium]|uniref:DUF1642 domain-containing protein n=1 Tax=Enterococcus faecium TaxID=1352 RepID=UPI00032F33CC|nr:DUF1642 domain-containing protein [Enterococcus faecium]EOG07651.1 hypothetical protein SKY_02062 [Enterococcus faecium EnGen0175]